MISMTFHCIHSDEFQQRVLKRKSEGRWGILQQQWLENPEYEEWDGGQRAIRHGQKIHYKNVDRVLNDDRIVEKNE